MNSSKSDYAETWYVKYQLLDILKSLEVIANPKENFGKKLE